MTTAVPATSAPWGRPNSLRRVLRPETVPSAARPVRVLGTGPPTHGNPGLPRMGLQLPRQMPFETWLRIGSQLSAVANSSAWCLGDWLTYGEVAYNGRYRDAVERTSLDYQTLRNYAWVARRFPMSRRRDTLSFGHHAEVAVLPEVEQDFWLRKAEELDWSRNQLRREVRASLRERGGQRDGRADRDDPDGPGAERDGSPGCRAELVISVTPLQLDEFERAANQAGLSLTAWAARTLEEAVRGVPPAAAGGSLALSPAVPVRRYQPNP